MSTTKSLTRHARITIAAMTAVAGSIIAAAPAQAAPAKLSKSGDKFVLRMPAGSASTSTTTRIDISPLGPGVLRVDFTHSNGLGTTLPSGCTTLDATHVRCDTTLPPTGGGANIIGSSGHDVVRVGSPFLGIPNEYTPLFPIDVQGGNGSDDIGPDPGAVTDFRMTMRGGAGGDELRANDNHGRLVFDGGDGVDTVYYERTFGQSGFGDVTVSLDGVANDGAGNDNVMTNVEVVHGGVGNDTFIGNSANNTFAGAGGADVFTGGRGKDTVRYDGTHDVGVTVTLDGVNNDGRSFEHDNVGADIENVVGTAFADSLTGNHLANRLTGGAGDDWLLGGSGNDTLDGGPGFDTLDGGSGTDTCLLGPEAGTKQRCEA